MTIDKINPSKRVRSWHRSHCAQAGGNAISLREFARNLLKHPHPPMPLIPSFQSIAKDWMDGKGMRA